MTEMTNYEDCIIRILQVRGAVKSRDLVMYVLQVINPTVFSQAEYDIALRDLSESGRVTFLMYTTEGYSTGMLYFPAKTTFHFDGKTNYDRSRESTRT